MAFIHKVGPAKTQGFLKTASITFAVGGLVAIRPGSGGGYIRPALVASVRIAGVCLRKVSSGDSDYASNTEIAVLQPGPDDFFEADVLGTLTQAHVGDQFDLADPSGMVVNLSGNTYKVVTVVGFISASKALVQINGAYQFANKAN